MSKYIDLTGKRFGHWTVIERDDSIAKKNIYWKCLCDCGTIRSVAGTSLRGGISVSCGCDKDLKTSIRTKSNVENLAGQRFGYWTVLYQDLSEGVSSKRGARWICRCDCGKEKSVLGYSLRFGRTTSCGCQNGVSHIVDLTGERYGRLVVLKKDDNEYNDKRGVRWICRCDCGNEVSVLSGRLKSGQTKSCGCLKGSNKNRKTNDLIGQKFGNWTVLQKDEACRGKGTFYICKCECGTIRSIRPSILTQGLSKSCGCARSIPKNDITGIKYGKLTVLGVDNESYNKGIYWKCKCECGTIKSYKRNILVNGNVKSCGCASRKKSAQRQFIDISNMRFGRLTAIEIDHKESDSYGNTEFWWKCKCDCGNMAVVQGTVLRRGDTKSCGCLQKEESAKRAKERTIDLLGKRFGLLTVIDRVSMEEDSTYSTWKCKCDCGNIKLVEGYNLRKGLVASCGCLKQSKYELFVIQYFNEMGYENPTDYESQKRFEGLVGYGDGKLSYDFSVNKNGKLYALIECQGQQHYMPVGIFGGEEQFAKQQLHDEIKRDYAKSINVPLIEIPYTVESYEEVKSILVSIGI